MTERAAWTLSTAIFILKWGGLLTNSLRCHGNRWRHRILRCHGYVTVNIRCHVSLLTEIHAQKRVSAELGRCQNHCNRGGGGGIFLKLARNKIAFQSKTDHPRMCSYSYARFVHSAPATLTFTRWPWYPDLTYRHSEDVPKRSF